jgi:hypothetical protein
MLEIKGQSDRVVNGVANGAKTANHRQPYFSLWLGHPIMEIVGFNSAQNT